MKYTLLAVICLLNIVSFAQTKSFQISGIVFSETENIPLESATVYLQREKDSALITYAISGRDGKFLLEGKTTDPYVNLYISYVGYQTYLQSISVKNGAMALGNVNLNINSNALGEILIKSTAPITIKKDTLEFNVNSFKTKKDANVEDLLKELPGVEISDEGTITINGKEVDKVLVNGKPFFGDDPTITTRNLTKDIVDKIQILDTKSKNQAFTGEEVDGENKTVNLVIKEENNKGVFGRVAAGTGTNEHYEFAGMFNYFDNDQRISVLAGGNDINSPGFSFGEIRKMFGGSIDSRSFGGGQGLVESSNLGANYADKLGEDKDVSGNYFYSGSSSENKSNSNRENFLADSKYFTTSNSRSFSDSDDHSANLEFDIKVDSTLLINIEPSFRYTKSKTSYAEDETSSDEFNELINRSNSQSNVETLGKNFNNDIDITKRFGSKGAFLRFSIENQINVRESDDYLESLTEVFEDDTKNIERNQYTDGENKINNFSSDITYRLPLIANEFFLEFKYEYNLNNQKDKKSTFNRDENSGLYDTFNTDLSTDFEYINETTTPALELEYRKENWSASFEASYIFRSLENKDLLRPDFSIARRFEALEFRSRLRYKFSAKASLRFGYDLNNDAPQLSNLQPFINVSNPLNTVIGNPNLEPETNHRGYVSFHSFDFQKGSGYYGYLRGTFESNTVVRKTIINENLLRETTFTNVNGAYSVNGYLAANKKVTLDSVRTATFDLGLAPNIQRSINFNNGFQYASTNTSLSPRAGIRFVWKDVLEFNPRYALSFTRNTFDLDNFKNQEFINHSLDLNTVSYLPKKFEWRNDIQFNYNPSISDGFQKSAWFWNSTLAYSVLKNNGNLTLKVYDLLNQNTNARRIATQNYIEDVESTVLQQYFMLSFSWKFNSLGKAGETSDERYYRH